MPVSAVLAAAVVSLTYVLVLYIGADLPRNHPQKIRLRAIGVAGACAVSWLPLAYVCWWQPPSQDDAASLSLASLLGLRLRGLAAAATAPLLLTAAAFAAPMVHMRFHTHLLDVLDDLRSGDLRTWRDVVIAPVAEEFVFRACLVPLFLLQGYSASATVLLVPLFFGAAHLHHLRELLGSGTPCAIALLQVACQFAYTTIYGWYAAYLFATTAHLAAPLLAHALCNTVGLPDFPAMLAGPHRLRHAALLAGGLVAFAALLPPLTRPRLYHNDVLPLRWWGDGDGVREWGLRWGVLRNGSSLGHSSF